MEWSGLEARQCLELLSWKVDVEWCGFFFSKAPPNGSYADTDLDWDHLATSLGLVAKIPISSPKTTAYGPVKVSGIVVLLGLGSYLCYKLYKVWLYQHSVTKTSAAFNSRGDDDSPPPPSSFSYSLNGLVPDPSTSINDFLNVKTHYFGPLHKKNEDCEQNYSDSRSDLILTLQPETMGQTVRSRERLKRSKLASPPSVNPRRGWLTQKLQCLVPNAQTCSGGQSPSNSTCTSSTGSSPISHPHHHSLSRDFSFDSFALFSSSHRQSSLDSMCSELSFDMPSFTEQTAENITVTRLDKLQEEIDQIKSNCQIIDEEFGTVKCNRNLPGLAELMETTEHRDGEQLSEQDIVRQQSAKACFKGLYSLTTINRSISMDLSVDEDSPQTSNQFGLTQLPEEELLPSLEWDDLNNWNAGTSEDSPPSPMLSSKMDTSGYSSKMDLSSPLSGSQYSCFESTVSPSEEVNEAVNSEMVRSMSCDSHSESINNDNCVTFRHMNIGSRVDIMLYAQQEWTGNTQKAKTILRGYTEIVETLQYRYIRLIRGDNYCALRSVIFQVLAQGLQVPSSSKTLARLSHAHNIGQWKFNGLPYHGTNVIRGMEICLQSLDNISALCQSNESYMNDQEETLYNLLNRDPSLDLHVMEAVKLHMMAAALDLHEANSKGQNVPLFSILMFARDTSEMPTDFMNNHLIKVGDSGGLEQVEMFLLGYTLGVSVKVIRPSAHGTHQFICFYPDDNVGSWPEVTLVAEDDRHYNVLCT